MSLQDDRSQLSTSFNNDGDEANNIESHEINAADTNEPRLKAYKRRWLVLAIVCLGISLRSFNQSCYGPINNILSEYFQVQPWQIDWLNSSHALVFVLLSFPMILVTTKLGFRLTVIAMGTLQTISFFLTTLGVVWRTTFSSALIGQIFMATSTIISGCIPPTTAAIWFPTDEVATAVAIQVVARGTGEAIGCVVPNLIIGNDHSPKNVMTSLVHMFFALTTIAFFLTITAIFGLKDSPPLPPSEAQAKVKEETAITDERAMSTLKKFSALVKKLFSNKVFIAIWFISGTQIVIFRSNTVLFTSVIRQNYLHQSDLNIKSGVSLLTGWIMYVVGSFISGPIITKTKAYKKMVVFSLLLLFISCILVLVSLQIENLKLSFSAIVLQGLFTGIASTSIFELLTEVVYPIKPMSAYMVTISLCGISMFIYFITGRLLLRSAGPVWSTALPIATAGLGLIVVLCIKPTYFRMQANRGMNENTQLIPNDRKD